eukprot:TRINITY_DN8611_c0_g1_i1.p1 TRINITY_DN8611_c0_g1~~TRINITY_DN8611_c0_g1_i1.p1  ORF type:complete len:602 (+),score=131.87 TRINITY_DN8611_c0_g1_i1:58-1863(+)
MSRSLQSSSARGIPTRLFGTFRQNQWNSKENQRRFFDRLFNVFELKDWRDWYQYGVEEIRTNGGGGIISHFGNHIYALMSAYPEHDWEIFRFQQTPYLFWKDESNQKHCMDQLGKHFGIKKADDWYEISSTTLSEINRNNKPISLISYHGTLYKALCAVYPSHKWDESKFVRPGYWSDKGRQRAFFDKLGKKLFIEKWQDWYNVSKDDIRSESQGTAILHHFNNSRKKALQSAYPEHPWLFTTFKTNSVGSETPQVLFARTIKELFPQHEVASNYSDSQLKDFDQKLDVYIPALKLGFCYSPFEFRGDRINFIKASKANGITTIVVPHWWDNTRESLLATIHAARPDVVQLPPPGSTPIQNEMWLEPSYLRRFLEKLASRFSVKKPEDWYFITLDNFIQNGGAETVKTFRKYFKNDDVLIQMLKVAYPEQQWERSNFEVKSRAQAHLHAIMIDTFPSTEIHSNFLHPKFKYEKSDHPIELDIFIPSLKLAFEYHGAQHFERPFGQQFLASAAEDRLGKDQQRRDACLAEGITLIEIPFWWDGSRFSILATIAKCRPDLAHSLGKIPEFAVPISMSAKDSAKKLKAHGSKNREAKDKRHHFK